MAKSATMNKRQRVFDRQMSVTLVASYLEMPARTLRHWAATSRVCAWRCGSQWRIDRLCAEGVAGWHPNDHAEHIGRLKKGRPSPRAKDETKGTKT